MVIRTTKIDNLISTRWIIQTNSVNIILYINVWQQIQEEAQLDLNSIQELERSWVSVEDKEYRQKPKKIKRYLKKRETKIIPNHRQELTEVWDFIPINENCHQMDWLWWQKTQPTIVIDIIKLKSEHIQQWTGNSINQELQSLSRQFLYVEREIPNNVIEELRTDIKSQKERNLNLREKPDGT